MLLTLPKSVQNILVIGPFYNKLDQIQDIFPQYDRIIFNDGITFSDNNISATKSQIGMMDRLLASGRVVYNVGCIDLCIANQMDILNSQQLAIANWIQTKPNIVKVDFGGSFRVLIMSGGIPTHITKLEQLNDNVEVSFATHPHSTYSGGLGYVVCNGAERLPQYHPYSVQLGSAVQGQLCALHMDRNGIKKTILV
jgi:hypothetical protein